MEKRGRTSWGRIHEEGYLTETSPHVWSHSGFTTRETGSNVATVTAAPFLPSPGKGRSRVGSHVLSMAMQYFCPPDRMHTVTLSFRLPEAGSPQGGSICHYGEPSDFKVHFWQMPSPPLPTWWYLQKTPMRPSLVKRSLGRDLWCVWWEKQLPIFYSFETSLPRELSENSFKIVIADIFILVWQA